MENKRTLQVKNDVYSLGRERNETNIYNITINYPQLEDGIGLNIDINKVNSLLKDAAFSVYAKTYVKAVAQLEEEEREKTGIRNLKVKYNKVFGYIFGYIFKIPM